MYEKYYINPSIIIAKNRAIITAKIACILYFLNLWDCFFFSQTLITLLASPILVSLPKVSCSKTTDAMSGVFPSLSAWS